MITAIKRQTSLFLLLVFYLAAAAAAAAFQHLSLRVGDEVTLFCGNVTYRSNCRIITWMISKNNGTLTLFEHGWMKVAAATPNRLSLTADCSLVIKKVSVEDAGLYICRQFKNGQQQGPDSMIQLSVVNMIHQSQKDKIILSCSVMEYNYCKHKVTWLNEGKEEMMSDIKISAHSCSATVIFPPSVKNLRRNLKCKVTNSYTKTVQLFAFRLQSSGDRKANNSTSTKTTTTKKTKMSATTINPPTITSVTTSTTESSCTSTGIKQSTSVNNLTKTPGWPWLYIIGSAAIIITVLVIIGWKKTKGNKTKKDEERKTDPEKRVYYTSIKTKRAEKTKKEPRVPDSGIYMNVKTSAQAIDPDSIYCNI